MHTRTQTRKHTHTPAQQMTIGTFVIERHLFGFRSALIWYVLYLRWVYKLFVSERIWCTFKLSRRNSQISNALRFVCLHPNPNPNRNLIQSISFANDKTFYTNLSKIDSMLWIRITKQWIAVSSDNKFNFLSFWSLV